MNPFRFLSNTLEYVLLPNLYRCEHLEQLITNLPTVCHLSLHANDCQLALSQVHRSLSRLSLRVYQWPMSHLVTLFSFLPSLIYLNLTGLLSDDVLDEPVNWEPLLLVLSGVQRVRINVHIKCQNRGTTRSIRRFNNSVAKMEDRANCKKFQMLMNEGMQKPWIHVCGSFDNI